MAAWLVPSRHILAAALLWVALWFMHRRAWITGAHAHAMEWFGRADPYRESFAQGNLDPHIEF